jgi:triosephosphate isomerase (TIM)
VSTTRKPLMAGNWKMNCNHLEAIRLVQELAFRLSDADYEAVEVVVLPPFTDLRSVQTMVDGDHLSLGYGAQDLSVHDSGAFTGEVSGPMLAKLGCGYVLAGHSERRQYHGEDDALVHAKVVAAHRNALVPVLCVGEPLEVRQADGHLPHVLGQLAAGLAGLSAEQVATTVVAYEPVWAIGTGEVATPEDAQEVCAALRGWVSEQVGPDVGQRTRVLYGGSMKADSAPGLMAKPDIDGGLVGGASLDAEEFVRVVRYHQATPE